MIYFLLATLYVRKIVKCLGSRIAGSHPGIEGGLYIPLRILIAHGEGFLPQTRQFRQMPVSQNASSIDPRRKDPGFDIKCGGLGVSAPIG
jgi:hypothetical protein